MKSKAASLRIILPIIVVISSLVGFERNYHPRFYDYGENVTILEVRQGELDFNHPPGIFTIWWQTGKRNVRIWPLPPYQTP